MNAQTNSFVGFSTLKGVHTVKNRVTEDLKIDESLYPPSLKQPCHTHQFASFSFVSSGSYLETFGKNTHTRQDSTLIFHPPQESHSVDFISDVRIVRVHFTVEKFSCIREQLAVFDAPMSCRTQSVCSLGSRLRKELREMDAASALAIEGLALEMLAEVTRNQTGTRKQNPPQWLKEVRDYLHDTFAESFVLGDVARIAGVHSTHLSRVFRENLGCTVGEYVRRLRVEFACRQILTTEISLSEIASRAGFSDQSHFNRTFKSLFNLTPREYRKMSRAR